MSIYHYQAFSSEGSLKKGVYDAGSEGEVRQYLKSQHLYPKEIRASRFQRKAGAASLKLDWAKWLPKKKIPNQSIMLFTRQLEVLLDASIPYDQALKMITAQTENAEFQSVLSDLRRRVVEGGGLADAMQQHPEVFTQMFISMVRSGENSGSLVMIMKRLADYYERQEKIRNTLRSAMIYPMFMCVFGVAVVLFMMNYIVPKITRIFESQDAILPLPTRILIQVSDFAANYWFVLIALAFAGSVAIGSYFKTKTGQHLLQKMEMRLPLLKKLTVKLMVARFCQTLGTLLSSGVDLKSALEIAKHVVANHVFQEKLEQMIVEVNNKGIPLSVAMSRVDYFPEYVHHVVAIGEEAARMDELLGKVSERMESEINTLMDGMSSLLQPAMILVIGGIVGFIALAILLPMMNMNQLLAP